MPDSVAFNPLRWLATHLVALSFSGFVVAGVWLGGLAERAPKTPPAQDLLEQAAIPATDDAATGDTSRIDASAKPQGPAGGHVPADKPSSDAGKPEVMEAKKRPPRLIGGSVPIQESPTVPPERQGATAPAADRDGFRPAIDPPVAIPAIQRDDYLQQARRAFWNGDFEAAETAYMEMLTLFPADADAFGELGNLYDAMGKREQSLDAYFEAGLRLKAAGDLERVKQVVELLKKEGDERSAVLAR